MYFCQRLSTSSSSVSSALLCCRADAPLTVCSRDGRGRARAKEMRERRRERGCTVKQLVRLTGLIHWQAAWRGRRGGGRGGREGKADRGESEEEGGGRGDRQQTVAGSPSNRSVDEGIWVWLGDCRGDVGQCESTASLTHCVCIRNNSPTNTHKYQKSSLYSSTAEH